VIAALHTLPTAIRLWNLTLAGPVPSGRTDFPAGRTRRVAANWPHATCVGDAPWTPRADLVSTALWHTAASEPPPQLSASERTQPEDNAISPYWKSELGLLRKAARHRPEADPRHPDSRLSRGLGCTIPPGRRKPPRGSALARKDDWIPVGRGSLTRDRVVDNRLPSPLIAASWRVAAAPCRSGACGPLIGPPPPSQIKAQPELITPSRFSPSVWSALARSRADWSRVIEGPSQLVPSPSAGHRSFWPAPDPCRA